MRRHGHPSPVGAQCGAEVTRLGIIEKFRLDGHVTVVTGACSGLGDSLAPRILLGRLGDPQELSATAVWLAADAAGYVTGQTIVVDGGVTIT